MPRPLYRRILFWELENVTALGDGCLGTSARERIPQLRRAAAANGSWHRCLRKWVAFVLIGAIFVAVAGAATPFGAQEAVTPLGAQLQQLIDQPKWESAF